MKREIAPGKCEPLTAPHVMEIQSTLVSNRPSQAALARCMFSDYQNDRTLAKGLSHHVGFYKLFDLSSSLRAFWPVESSERCGTSSAGFAHSFTTFILPNPRSINQAKPLDRLSPRAE